MVVGGGVENAGSVATGEFFFKKTLKVYSNVIYNLMRGET